MASTDLSRLLVLVALPLLVLASDFYSIFVVRPPHPPPRPHHQHDLSPQPRISPVFSHPSQISGQTGVADPASLGGKFHISFCSSCSYKKAALDTRASLMSLSPGTDVVLSNYPPSFPKRILIKVLPLVQFAGIGLVVGGDHLFPRLGYAYPPAWYNTLRQNKFGAASGFWLIGNVLQNTLQSTGAFEVYFDGHLIFSKLREGRFPYEFELQELVGKTLELKTML